LEGAAIDRSGEEAGHGGFWFLSRERREGKRTASIRAVGPRDGVMRGGDWCLLVWMASRFITEERKGRATRERRWLLRGRGRRRREGEEGEGDVGEEWGWARESFVRC
jgi:hypothetical protein